MHSKVNLVDEIIDFLELNDASKTNIIEIGVEGLADWLYDHTNVVSAFILGKYRTLEVLEDDGKTSEDFAAEIIEKLSKE